MKKFMLINFDEGAKIIADCSTKDEVIQLMEQFYKQTDGKCLLKIYDFSKQSDFETLLTLYEIGAI